MKCRTCARRLDLEKLDYTVGCKHEQMEGFICLACAFEGVAYWMTNVSEDDYCEEYVPKRIELVGKSDTLEWIPCSERLPKENVPVNITWVNRNPVSYYADIKGIPFTATGVYFEGKWYWWSSIVEDLLAEHGRTQWDRIVELMDESIEVIAWMPLPKPYREDGEV